MKYLNRITLCIFTLSFNLIVISEISEYKIEYLIFKYVDNSTDEIFRDELNVPSDNIIIFNTLDNDEFPYSNFSNISEFFQKILSDENDSDINKPNIFLREDNNIIALIKFKSKIEKKKNIELIDHNSWLQTIPNYEKSKFIEIKNDNGYRLYLKLYKKRFFHMDIKTYIEEKSNDKKNKKLFIDEERRFFENEIHFFDHPNFGVIISISEVDHL